MVLLWTELRKLEELILLIYPGICAKNDIAPFIIHE